MSSTGIFLSAKTCFTYLFLVFSQFGQNLKVIHLIYCLTCWYTFNLDYDHHLNQSNLRSCQTIENRTDKMRTPKSTWSRVSHWQIYQIFRTWFAQNAEQPYTIICQVRDFYKKKECEDHQNTEQKGEYHPQ